LFGAAFGRVCLVGLVCLVLPPAEFIWFVWFVWFVWCCLRQSLFGLSGSFGSEFKIPAKPDSKFQIQNAGKAGL
jgi:hypothetical protein